MMEILKVYYRLCDFTRNITMSIKKMQGVLVGTKIIPGHSLLNLI